MIKMVTITRLDWQREWMPRNSHDFALEVLSGPLLKNQ